MYYCRWYIRNRKYNLLIALLTFLLIYTPFAMWAWPDELAGHEVAFTFLALAIVLILSKIGTLVEKVWFPGVLGQLIMWVIIGNLFLLNIDFFEYIKNHELLLFLSQLWVLILLFQIWLESEINKLKKVGGPAFAVAILGVVLPFLFGFGSSYFLLYEHWLETWLWLGAAFTATSVWITMQVFKDNNKVDSKEGQLVLWAAVIDDVMGLLILAIVSSMIAWWGGFDLQETWIVIFQAIVFLFWAIAIGQLLEDPISKLFSKISTWIGMKFTIVISFCLIFAFLADLAWLDPIIWAFAAGLILDPVHFKYYKDQHIVQDIKDYISTVRLTEQNKKDFNKMIKSHERRELEELMEPLEMMLVPVFFVMTGMQLDLTVFSEFNIVLLSLIFTLLAFLWKYLSWFAAKDANKHIVGLGMVPRWEVGLVFASMGLSIWAINEEVFWIIVIVVILTTIIAPIFLNSMLKNKQEGNSWQ